VLYFDLSGNPRASDLFEQLDCRRVAHGVLFSDAPFFKKIVLNVGEI